MHDARTLRPGDGHYPAPIAALPGRPDELRLRGTLPAPGQRCVAVVGTRRPDEYGEDVAGSLVAGLARAGVSVVSGGALGIDTVAHRAALGAGGHTVAVFGTGLDVFHPPSNRALFERVVAAGGALLSAYPDGTPGWRGNFPERNLLVAALAEAVVVVQAGASSGALITARFAERLGRPVLAVPGDVREPGNAGCLALLRRGARPAAEAKDVLDVLGIAPGRAASPELPMPGLALPGPEAALLRALGRKPRHADELAREAGLGPGRVLAGLMSLELRGLCEQRPGHYFLRRSGEGI